MNTKRIIGIVIVIVGILCIGFSAYINKKVEAELGKVQNATDTIQNNAVTEWGGKAAKNVADFFGGQINQAAANKAAPYSKTAKVIFYSGIFLIIVGAGVAFLSKRKVR